MEVSVFLTRATADVLALVLLASAASKLRSAGALHQFAAVVVSYELLPRAIAVAWSRLVPVIELAIAVILFTGMASYGALALIPLLGSFAVAVAINLIRGRSVACGCFGADEAITGRTLARLALLITAALVVASIEPLQVGTSERLGAFFSAVLMIAAGMWLLRADTAIFVLRRLGG